MKLIAHIVWKDLTRLRWWLVLWVVALALPILDGVELILHSPLPLPNDHWNRPHTHAGLVAVQMIAGCLMALLLFDEDRVAGTSQFWSTRPVAGGRLWTSKVVSACVIEWLIPGLVALPWWCWCGFGPGQIGGAMADKFAIAIVVTVPIAAIASLTDSLSRTLVWSLVAGISLIVLFFVVEVWAPNTAAFGARLRFIAGMILAEMLLLTLVRFFWPRRWWPVVVLGAGVIATVWYGRSLPGRVLIPVQEWHPERAAGIQFHFDHTSVRRYAESPNPEAVFETWLEFERSPTCGIGILTANQTVTWKNGPTLNLNPPMIGGTWRVEVNPPLLPAGLHPIAADPETEAWQKAQFARLKARFPMISRGHRRVPSSPGVSLDGAVLDTLLPKETAAKADYTAKLLAAAMSLQIADEVPLEPGRWQAHLGYGIRIDYVRRDGETMAFATSRPAPLAVFLQRSGWRGWLRESTWRKFLLIDRRRQECIEVAPYKAVSLDVCGVEVAWQSASFGLPHVIRNGVWVRRNDGWLDHATLGVVATTTESIFERTVTAKNVAIEETKADDDSPSVATP